MEQQISKAELKRLFTPGMKLKLTECLLGPVAAEKQPRQVAEVKSYGFVMTRPDGQPSYMRLDGKGRVTRDGNVVRIYEEERLAARYEIVAYEPVIHN